FGANCQSCHTTSTFTVAQGGQVHDLGFFKLQGEHDQLACVDCHRQDTSLQGTGSFCADCHEKNDPHVGRSGATCGDCHDQLAWLPTTFKHNHTGFRLTGAHRYLDCQDCHFNQIYQGLPSDCYFCHSDSNLQSLTTLHAA